MLFRVNQESFFFLTGPLAFRKVLPYGLWKKFKKPQNAFGILCCETKLTLNYLFLTWPPFKWKKTCHMIGKFFFLGNLDPVTSKYGGIVQKNVTDDCGQICWKWSKMYKKAQQKYRPATTWAIGYLREHLGEGATLRVNKIRLTSVI